MFEYSGLGLVGIWELAVGSRGEQQANAGIEQQANAGILLSALLLLHLLLLLLLLLLRRSCGWCSCCSSSLRVNEKMPICE
jgi:hypothetical protein